MKALIFLYKKTIWNRIKRALRKPVTYLYIVLVVGYLVFIGGSIFSFSTDVQIDSPKMLAIILAGLVLFMVPSNIVTFAKRKGLIFKPSDTHFVFTAPLNPKMVLVYAFVKTLFLSMLFQVAITIAGYMLFNIQLWKMLLYFGFTFGVETVFETCLMILLYGNERLPEKALKWLGRSMWLILLALAAIFALMIYQNGWAVQTFETIMFSPVFESVPIIGWNVAVIHLLILGSTTANVINTSLYCGITVCALIAARRMKCTGMYYEDAAKFADDYQELKKKGQKGEVGNPFAFGKKKKYGKAEIEYKGNYAKAIFYRQLLEYKKNKFFIFGMMTVVCLCAGIGLAVFTYMTDFPKQYAVFIILGAAAYICFCLSAYATKWAKEMENPYTFLIPDTPLRKLWYATVIEHIRSIIDGCLIVIPPSIVCGISLVNMVLMILVYVCIQANRLYSGILAEAMLGKILGNVGKQLTRMLVQGGVIGIGALIAAVAGIAFSVTVGFTLMVVYAVVITIVIAVLASVLFASMESISD